MDPKIEFYFELPQNLKPFGLSPGETTRKKVIKFIKRENALIMTPERPSPTQDNLLNPNASEMVIGGLKQIYGFPLKGLILNFYKGIIDKIFCVFEQGDAPEITFFRIFNKLESDIFGQPSVIQTPAERDDWNISWDYTWFSISLFLHRNTSDLMLLFSDKSFQRMICQEEKEIFSNYMERQMRDTK
jgi:hypothetical protein